MTEIKTQKAAIEALADWAFNHGIASHGSSEWAADYYASLMRENVAAMCQVAEDKLLGASEMRLVTYTLQARDLTHATIQSLVEGASDE